MRAIHLFPVPLLFLQTACTVVEVDGGRAIVHGGNLRLVAPDNSEIIAVRSRGFGLVSGLRSTTLGYQDEFAVVKTAADACAIIVVDANLDDDGRKFWREVAGNREDICVK